MESARLFWTKPSRKGFYRTGDKPKKLTARQRRFLWICAKKGIEVVK